MESPNKRLKPSPSVDEDFVPLGRDEEEEAIERFGYGNENTIPQDAPTGPRANRERHHHNGRYRVARLDRRNAQDGPKSKHALPGHESWVLVKTKLGRRFVHNTHTKESTWHVPDPIWPAVKDFEAWEKQQKEKEENAQWAEEELKKMRERSQAEEVSTKADAEERRSRRKRSESLQREDEEAMMAELAAQAEQAEERDVREVVKTLELVGGEFGYDSEGSFEYVEVTDDEDEEGAEEGKKADVDGEGEEQTAEDGAPVEFGEDDIAYQLAAMGEEYGLDPEDYGFAPEEDDDDEQGLSISASDAANLFRDLLDDYQISPFTPWETLVADESASSILNDDRYTVLPSMRARKEVWDAWVRDKAALIKEERARMEKKDPRIPYLAFLAEKATPKLYWPEFKRKFKKEVEMNDRKLGDKGRERLYREHVNRMKLPESARKADLITLLKSTPLRELSISTTPDTLPQQLLSHLHFISLPAPTRNQVITAHIASLPEVPEADDLSDEVGAEEERKRAEKRRREDALAERQRQVDEERRRVEKEERVARRGLREEERELARAMVGPGRGGRGVVGE